MILVSFANPLEQECPRRLECADLAMHFLPFTAVHLFCFGRLGCQITLAKELEGMEVTLPAYARNFYVDGHVPEPH